jgi:hypothetical protein
MRSLVMHRYIMIGVLMCAVSYCFAFGTSSGSLSQVVTQVKQMITQGKPRSDIAGYVHRVVDERIISMNRDTPDEKGALGNHAFAINKQVFDAWSNEGTDVDEPYAAAHWSWQNRVGHCQENAHTVYHILMMALGSGEEVSEFACGDHIYVVWGIPRGFTGKVTIDTLNSWQNAYIIDPWLGVCKSTADVGRLDLTLIKAGFYAIDRVANWSYSTYERKYETWLNSCEDFKGNYGAASDKLIVTEVSGQSNIAVGQTQYMKPAGIFQVSQNKREVTVAFRAAKISGTAVGRIAVLNNKEQGTIDLITLTKVKIGGKDKLKVLLKTVNPGTGAVIVREGILTKM